MEGGGLTVGCDDAAATAALSAALNSSCISDFGFSSMETSAEAAAPAPAPANDMTAQGLCSNSGSRGSNYGNKSSFDQPPATVRARFCFALCCCVVALNAQ